MPTSSEICKHCRLPLAAGQQQFCCGGCEAVYGAIHYHGLGEYYAFQERPGVAASARLDDYGYLDDPALLGRAVSLDGASCTTELLLEGVHCTACLWLLEKLPSVLPGVTEARLAYADSRLRVTWEADKTSLAKIGRCLAQLGYPPHLMSAGAAAGIQRKSDRTLLARIGIAGAAFGNVMLLSFALYSAEDTGMVDFSENFFRWASMLIAVPSVLWTAQPFFQGAKAALRTRTALVDLPISVGIAAALIGGTVATVRGSGEIYFDSVTMLVFFLLAGRYLQSRGQQVARAATDLMFALAPSTCRVVAEGRVQEVPTSSVVAGARVEILAGERIGVDGVVLEGESSVDEAMLSGESAPRLTVVDSPVHAGTVNLSGRLLVLATQTGAQTRLAQLVKDVEMAAADKAPIVALADRAAGVFTWVVLGLSFVTFALWWSSGPTVAVERTLALLIVTCPCALGLATPLATSVALGRAAKAGILIKGGQYLEALARPALVVFDKTGTLTEGKLQLTDWDENEELSTLVRSAEACSSHPVARALTQQLPGSGVLVADRFHEQQGGGVEAWFGNRHVAVGNARFVADRLVDHPQAGSNLDSDTGPLAKAKGASLLAEALLADERSQQILGQGLSPIYVAVNGALRTIAGLGDPIRPEATDSLRALAARGCRLALLSGDEEAIVQRVVAHLGVPFETIRSRQSPEDKLRFVQQACTLGPVVMVGDGVNDAAALTAASVGIAIHGGAEASIAAADVFSTRSGIQPVMELFTGARHTLRTIKQNLTFSLVYNVLTAGLAISGWISPLLAAALMPLSSLAVLSNSLRASSFRQLSPSPHGARDQSKTAPQRKVVSTSPAAATQGATGRRGKRPATAEVPAPSGEAIIRGNKAQRLRPETPL